MTRPAAPGPPPSRPHRHARCPRGAVPTAFGRQDTQVVAAPGHQPGPGAADVEPVELADQFGDLALAQVEPLQGGPRRVVVHVRLALAEDAGYGLTQPGEAVLDRPQSRAPRLGHGQPFHADLRTVRV